MARKPIPDPIYLPPQAPQFDPFAISLPFAIAEAPRTFINFLALHTNIPKSYRDKIADWLLGYNEMLAEYLHAAYGPMGVAAGEAIAQQVGKNFLETVTELYNEAEGDFFNRLEDEMRDE
ncbi:Uncharacterised protein [Mycobacteroides abscessus subsp. abscessus]|uniref:Uncharacterized protein n=1 Tax=Mycobacteroides abscessus subsp. abscessus TaxID=1185650 RepID=A0AB38D0F2_9MYCO|nr:hypothetical protein [Mycobacteroides abscessus]SKU87742.1 Uncharacterised protein [Mycobacteroides abscessus subsp. bolletii]SHX06370.1 Uncharacterised protein [Mycobacteroides abscessus subsp. abscessus]SIA11900.1 Uncharacterised protein [Mycobacteroides abscessus subsp. abscessus]SIB14216.1 Uncharacterised protein [Mycobacteroides abscessus subsp. abscessus]SIB14483.1 Uncharacterised protein [Mycobacteroides abscessus subsp. abscessus]